MATKAPGEIIHDHRGTRREWLGLGGNDTGDWIIVEGSADVHFQVSGTIDGGTFTIEGTDDPNEVIIGTIQLTDLSAASFTVLPDFVQILQVPHKIRPNMTGGGASASVDVIVNIKGYR